MLNADLSKRYPNYASLIGDLQSALIEVGGARRPMTRNLKRASAGGAAPAKEYEAKPSLAPARKQPTVRHPTERKITASQSSLKRTTGRLGKGRRAEKGMSGLAIGVIVLLAIALIVFLVVKLSGVAGARPSGPEPVAPRPAVAGAKPTAASPEKVRESGLITFEDGKFVACRGYGGQGTVSVSDGGKTVRLAGSVWKAYPLKYTAQSATVLEFDFKSQKQGNLQGIALASDSGAKTDRLFKLYGARDSGLAVLPYDSSAPQLKHYVIPVGQYFTGPVMFILFANDDISPKQDAESTYSNLRVYNR
jgi:hypothetical protein